MVNIPISLQRFLSPLIFLLFITLLSLHTTPAFSQCLSSISRSVSPAAAEGSGFDQDNIKTLISFQDHEQTQWLAYSTQLDQQQSPAYSTCAGIYMTSDQGNTLDNVTCLARTDEQHVWAINVLVAVNLTEPNSNETVTWLLGVSSQLQPSLRELSPNVRYVVAVDLATMSIVWNVTHNSLVMTQEYDMTLAINGNTQSTILVGSTQGILALSLLTGDISWYYTPAMGNDSVSAYVTGVIDSIPSVVILSTASNESSNDCRAWFININNGNSYKTIASIASLNTDTSSDFTCSPGILLFSMGSGSSSSSSSSSSEQIDTFSTSSDSFTSQEFNTIVFAGQSTNSKLGSLIVVNTTSATPIKLYNTSFALDCDFAGAETCSSVVDVVYTKSNNNALIHIFTGTTYQSFAAATGEVQIAPKSLNLSVAISHPVQVVYVTDATNTNYGFNSGTPTLTTTTTFLLPATRLSAACDSYLVLYEPESGTTRWQSCGINQQETAADDDQAFATPLLSYALSQSLVFLSSSNGTKATPLWSIDFTSNCTCDSVVLDCVSSELEEEHHSNTGAPDSLIGIIVAVIIIIVLVCCKRIADNPPDLQDMFPCLR